VKFCVGCDIEYCQFCDTSATAFPVACDSAKSSIVGYRSTMNSSPPRLAKFAVALLLLFSCSAHPTASITAPSGPAPSIPSQPWHHAAAIDALIAHSDTETDNKFTGFVLLAEKGRALYQRGFGEISHDSKKSNNLPNADTTFRIGSVTKTFTSAAIMLLIRDKKLSLEQTLNSLALGVPDKFSNITIKQLLSHTSGISDFTSLPNYNDFKAKPLSSPELLAMIWRGVSDFAPGEKYQYSNSGYVILGVIIEKITGQPFAEFFQKRLFDPAGMKRTYVGDAGAPNMATGYSDGSEADAISMMVPHAAGSIRSTARDLLAWHTLLQSDFLSADEKALLYTPIKGNYALGWMKSVIVPGKDAIGHGGGIDGFLTSFLRMPDDDVVAIVLCNSTDNDPEEVAMALLQSYLGHPPVNSSAVAYDLAKAKQLAGTYDISAASKSELAGVVPPAVLEQIASITLTANTDGLVFKPVGHPPQVMTPYADGSYRQSALKVTITFATTDGVATMIVQQGATTVRYQRSK
jgi:CubicO group peptidase (beta-lactamase class C family)